MARGRPKKMNVRRDRTGKSRGEPHEVDPRSLAARGRDLRADGIDASHARDPLSGFTLGRLRLIGLAGERGDEGDPRGISARQYEAGDAWARLCRRHSAIMGYSMGSPKSPGFVMVSNGLDRGGELDEDEVIRIRRRWSDCYAALMRAGVLHGVGTKIALIAWDVCVNNRQIASMAEDDFGNLRIGLNSLGRVL